MTPHPQSNSGLYGYPYPEPIWEPPLIDLQHRHKRRSRCNCAARTDEWRSLDAVRR